MNRIGLILAGCFVAQMVCGEPFEITSYAPKTGAVGIKNGATYITRSFDSFSTEEQRRIASWLEDKEFLSSFGLDITVERQKDPAAVYDTEVTPNRPNSKSHGKKVEIVTGQSQNVSYEIKLKNLSPVEFKNIKVEYRVFYETQDGSESAKKCAHGKVDCQRLLPNEEWCRKTPDVNIRTAKKENTAVEWKGKDIKNARSTTQTEMVQDKLLGAHLCIIKENSSGASVQREVVVGIPPEKTDWAEYSSADPAEKQTSEPRKTQTVVAKDMTEEQKKQLTRNATSGNYMSALVLSEYYYGQGDQKTSKQWADTVKRLIKSRPKGQQEEAEARLAQIGQFEKP